MSLSVGVVVVENVTWTEKAFSTMQSIPVFLYVYKNVYVCVWYVYTRM